MVNVGIYKSHGFLWVLNHVNLKGICIHNSFIFRTHQKTWNSDTSNSLCSFGTCRSIRENHHSTTNINRGLGEIM